MIFRYIRNNPEFFELDLERAPHAIAIRMQVITAFVAVALGKGGLIVATYFIAMAILDGAQLPYALGVSALSLALLTIGVFSWYGRIVVSVDTQTGQVEVLRRAPLYSRRLTAPLSAYAGVALTRKTDEQGRTIYGLDLRHVDDDKTAPLMRRRMEEPPVEQWDAYARAFGLPKLER
ncbi:MAG: hypothetical protein HQL36_11355 [Alphaproteobacteria bacterium]|nr:hypothetical protein [Alphaproteobacteria bacterium]MBF0249207.1 hypothetical protein [Alphaproteobacteria bacterium]